MDSGTDPLKMSSLCLTVRWFRFIQSALAVWSSVVWNRSLLGIVVAFGWLVAVGAAHVPCGAFFTEVGPEL